MMALDPVTPLRTGSCSPSSSSSTFDRGEDVRSGAITVVAGTVTTTEARAMTHPGTAETRRSGLFNLCAPC